MQALDRSHEACQRVGSQLQELERAFRIVMVEGLAHSGPPRTQTDVLEVRPSPGLL